MYTLNKVSSHPFSRRITWSWSETGTFYGKTSFSSVIKFKDGGAQERYSQSYSSSASGSQSMSYESIYDCSGITIQSNHEYERAEGFDRGTDGVYTTSQKFKTEYKTTITLSQEEITATKATNRDGFSQNSSMILDSMGFESTFVQADKTVREFTTTNVSGLITLTTKGVTTETLGWSLVDSLSTVGTAALVALNGTMTTADTASAGYEGHYNYTVYAEKGERLVSVVEGGLKLAELPLGTTTSVAVDLTYFSRSRSTSLRSRHPNPAEPMSYPNSVTFTVGFSKTYEYTYISIVPLPERSITYADLSGPFELPMKTTKRAAQGFASSKTEKSTSTIRNGMVQYGTNTDWKFPTVTAFHGKVVLTETEFYEVDEWGTAYTFHEAYGSTTINTVIGKKQVSYNWTTWEDVVPLFSSSASGSTKTVESTSTSYEGTFWPDFGLPNPYTVRKAGGRTDIGSSNRVSAEGFTEVIASKSMVTKPVVYSTPAITRSHVYEVGVVGEDTSVRGLIYKGATIGGTYSEGSLTKARPEYPELVGVALGLSSLRPKTDKYVTISHLSVTFRPDITAHTSKSDYASLTRKTSSASVSLEGDVNSSVILAPNLSEGDPKGGTFLWNVDAGHYTNVDGGGKFVKEFKAYSKSDSAKLTAYLPLPCLSGVQEVVQMYSTSVTVLRLPDVSDIAEVDQV